MPLEIFKVTDTILCVRRRSYFSCSYLVRTADGLIAIDAGMASDGTDVLQGLAHLGEPVSDLRAMLLTHWHNDHVAGAAAIVELASVPVYYHAGEKPFLTGEVAHGGIRGAISELIPELGLLVLFKGLLKDAPPRSVSATRYVEDGEERFGLEVIAAPGHTPGSVAYYYKAERVMFSGDALAVVGKEIRFMARGVTPDKPRARASMERLLAYDMDILCPGHRYPLKERVNEARRSALAKVVSSDAWPLLG